MLVDRIVAWASESSVSEVLRTERGAPVLARLRNNLFAGSAFLFWALMLANVIAYAYQMVMARMMSPADYSILVTLTSLSYVLEVFLRTIQVSVTDSTARAAHGTTGAVRSVFSSALAALVPVAILAFLCNWLASDWTARFFQLGATTPVVLFGLFAASTFLTPVPRGMLLGLNRLGRAGATIVAEPVARLAMGIVLVCLGLRANGALAGYAAGSWVALLVAMLLVRPLLPQLADRPVRSGFARHPDGYAFWVLLINMCLMLMASLDQMTIQHFFPAEVSGNYAVAFILGRVIIMSAISLGIVIFTRSATSQAGEMARTHVLAKGMAVIGGISLLATVAFLAVPSSIIWLAAGDAYVMAPAYIGLVGVETTLFGLIYIQAYYHISLHRTVIVLPLALATALEITILTLYHSSIQEILYILIAVMVGLFVCVSALSWWILRSGRITLPSVDQRPLHE